MNDRFKFRFFETYNNTMLDCKDYDFNEILESGKPVMQCTGRKDKNCKLIYEGDIVKYTSIYSGNLTGIVYWDSETLQYKLKLLYSSGEIYADRDLVYFVNKNGLEKVGNIYENKELLEDTDER